MTTPTRWSLVCGDVLPGCPAVFHGTTPDDVLRQVAPHAADAHGITSLDDDTRELVTAAIRPVS